MENSPFTQELDALNVIQMTTMDPSGVDVNVTHIGGEHRFLLMPDEVSTVSLSPSLSEVTGPEDRQKGIQVSATTFPAAPFSVYGINNKFGSVDGYLALPCTNLAPSYDYYAVSVPTREAIRRNASSAFLIVACEDQTLVTYSIAGIDSQTAVTLNKGETYYVSQENDLTGTYVSSDRPISFFSGHECWVSGDGGSEDCNHLVEQLPPVRTWGNVFLTAPLIVSDRRTNITALLPSIIKIVTGDRLAIINITCTVRSSDRTNLFVRQSYNFTMGPSAYCSVESNIPILVAQFPIPSASGLDSVFMTLVPAVSQYRNNITVVPFGGETDDWINVFVPAEHFDTNDIIFGDSTTSPEGWTPIRCSSGEVCGYILFASVRVQSTLIWHRNPNATLGVITYGHSTGDSLGRASYGYPAGLSLILSEGNVYLCVCRHSISCRTALSYV